MTCYSPLLRVENMHKYDKKGTKQRYAVQIIPACDRDKKIEELKMHPWYKYTLIPCKQCIGCRLDYSRDWANRAYLEQQYHDTAWFVTLTYDNEHIPIPINEDFTCPKNWTGTLCKEDLRDFWHDLRQVMQREYNHTGIRYLACGEYGSQTLRPHYHSIIWNLPLPTETFYKPRIRNGNTYYQNTIIERVWHHGNIMISDATWNTAAYVARYITKKQMGKDANEIYAKAGLVKEFISVSKGIGKAYYMEHKDEIYRNDKILVKTSKGPKLEQPPKYFDRLMEKENEKRIEEIKKKRRIKVQNENKKFRIDNKKTELTKLQSLKKQEEDKKTKTKMLIRPL